MVVIKYGKSNGPRTSQGRRRLRRKELQEEYRSSGADTGPPKPNRIQAQLSKKAFIPISIFLAAPLKEIANKAALSISDYHLCLERATVLYEREFNRVEEEKPYLDAMSRVVNHAHQRNPKKKW